MYNILICDDERDIVSALKIYLKPEGYQLFTAFTGTEAVPLSAVFRQPEQPVLMQAQGGSLELTVDGDLFKVELAFPCA